MAVNFQPQHVWKAPGRSSRSCYRFSLPTTSLSRHMAMCTGVVCTMQCSMPVRLGHWQSQTSNVCSELMGQWSDKSAMSSRKTLSLPGPVSYLCGFAFEYLDLILKEKRLCWYGRGTLQWCSQDSLWHTGWWKGGPRWHGSRWQRGIAVYLTSLGRPTDIGLQLGKACYPCSG